MIKPKCSKCGKELVRLIYYTNKANRYSPFHYCYHCEKIFKIKLVFKEQKWN